MKVEEMIEAVQRKLGVAVDGRAGPQTWGEIYQRIVGAPGPAPAPAGINAVDVRSEKAIATLLPEVRGYARALVHRAASHDIAVKIISGTRSYAEQNALYARGRTEPGPIVTNARGGHSNHNFGIAFDIGVFEGSRYLGDSPKYQAVGLLGGELGLEWGGNWTDFVDRPHFQLRPAWAEGLSSRELLAELRTRTASHQPVYA
ncbi:M15 family metallopeptidase [Malikia sp.]|uniref:M15 family metallopeptidase n=1 Tax=Malikia sp. TaxID=2070706 RepID=UPI0026099761|nr:M15 family metallopeptidase [Malikia sp.]MDD2727992.1 M15 family metallopeptidase [Malikia sp.]